MHILIKQTVLKSLFNAVAYIFLNILILLSVITMQWLFICQVRSAQFFGKILHFNKKTKLRKIRKNKPHDTRFIRFIF